MRPILLSQQRVLTETAETLAIATAGAVSFVLLNLPAALISGSVVFVATAALAGRPMRVPLPLARIGYVIVGILLGTVVTPETLHGIAAWPGSILLLMLCSIVMMAATMAYLRIVHNWDLFSALLGASPGAMAQVISLSTELGGDLRAIAIVQTMRVSCCSSSGCPTDWRCSVSWCRRCRRRAARRIWRCSARWSCWSQSRSFSLLLSCGCDFRRASVRRHGRLGRAARNGARSGRPAVVDRLLLR